ncbi:unclassified [Brachyspira pilosicoli WesB]|uniref:Unclassified n=2 Tax=Brachyspira pilosicoli TaxID=52584 RepID=K0JH14_BRAPL|nr:unclassified [Brachyspira pilosicoli WesB]
MFLLSDFSYNLLTKYIILVILYNIINIIGGVMINIIFLQLLKLTLKQLLLSYEKIIIEKDRENFNIRINDTDNISFKLSSEYIKDINNERDIKKEDILKMRGEGMTQVSIASITGLSQSYISKVLKENYEEGANYEKK